MKRFFNICFRSLIITCMALLIIFCLMFFLIQTSWGKQQITHRLTSQLEKIGICSHIVGLEGQLPFSWKIDQIILTLCSDHFTPQISLENIHVRIAFFPLLQGQLTIDYFNAETGKYIDLSHSHTTLPPCTWADLKIHIQKKIQQFTLPISCHIHHLRIERVDIPFPHPLAFSLFFQGKWNASHEEFSAICKTNALDNPQIFTKVFINGSQKHNEISVRLKTHLNGISSILLPDPISSIEDLFCECLIQGTWDSWQSFIWNTDHDRLQRPLVCKLKTSLSTLQSNKYPLLNGNWQLASQLSFSANNPLIVERFQLLSDLIQCRGKGTIHPEISQSHGTIAYVLPNLFLLYDLEGSCKGGIHYDKGDLNTTLSTSILKWKKGDIGKIQAQLLAHYTPNLWKGSVNLSCNHPSAEIIYKNNLKNRKFSKEATQNPHPIREVAFKTTPLESDEDFKEKLTLPQTDSSNYACIKGSSLLTWIPHHQITLENLHIHTTDTSIAGNLQIQLPHYLLEGSLYGNIENLKHLIPLFPQPPLIEGRLGIQCTLTHLNGSQSLNLNLLSNQLRYDHYFIDKLSLSTQIANLYQQMEGSAECIAEKINTPYAYFNQISLKTFSESALWPFNMTLQGFDGTFFSPDPQQNQCQLSILGTWEQQHKQLKIHMNHGEGIVAQQNFSLQHPSTFILNTSQMSLSPCEWRIGAGSFSASGSLSPIHSFLQWQIENFPLKTLSLFNPYISIDGSMTSSGFVDATESNLEGSCNIALQHTHFLHNNQKPFKTKGSLQAHLNHNRLQIHTHLSAINEQFLEGSASLPFTYSCYPLQIAIDPDEPLTGQFILEGQIQDLFNFINAGTHHMTGLISANLLLSHTWQDPYIQGNISLQKGTYHNDYTGTILKEIDAEMNTHQQHLTLTHLTAHDEEKGIINAQGSLELNPSSYFPYTISAQLDQINLIHFDTIDGQLTGPLSIKGTSQSALAQGDLTIPFATIHIPDQLPIDITELPAQFINRPTHLINPSLSSRTPFPLHMDLNLSADRDIHVVGKGLSSEWKGSLHLTGTNTQIAANGKLSLQSGEYLFSGKIFKLIEGNIIFNDKPSPSATLNLSGSLSLSNLEVIAQLRGPLTSPQLTFHSNPHMPTSTILAKILFNKDISDISHPEALQLANTLMSLSGGTGPDVLETIRKNLGVDRLTITSAHAGSDQIAIQIGKYLTKGVLITLSQSATSSQVMVEVELNKDFIFQAETQEEEEGKFSLKWRKSY